MKSESDQNKLTFNINYYPVFQNVRIILLELHILLKTDQEHKKVFQDIPLLGFPNGKSLKDQLVRTKLPNVEITGRSETCGKKNCQVCDLFKQTLIQSGILNCNSQKVVYLLKCRICDEAPYVGKAKTKFRVGYNNYESAHSPIEKKRKVSQPRFQEHYGSQRSFHKHYG